MYHMVTGRPPFEGDTPSAVMHKHLKQPLVPPDHLNTSLSAGIGEIIEVAMAKNRDERYARTEDMLEDLRAVASGNPPMHARKTVDLDALGQIEERGKTVDIAPVVPLSNSLWSQPAFLAIAIAGGASVILNLVLILMMVLHK